MLEMYSLFELFQTSRFQAGKPSGFKAKEIIIIIIIMGDHMGLPESHTLTTLIGI